MMPAGEGASFSTRRARKTNHPFALADTAMVDDHFVRSRLFDTKGQSSRLVVGDNGERSAKRQSIEDLRDFCRPLPDGKSTQINTRYVHINGSAFSLMGRTTAWRRRGKRGERSKRNRHFELPSTCCCGPGGNASICLRKSASVQICSSESERVNAGMPVSRMPCLTFQKVSPSGSSSTPCLASCGACW